MHNKYQPENNFNREPAWILRWGSVLIFLFFSVSILLASVFSFNEVIRGNVIITSKNPPVQIQSQNAGKILKMNYHPGDSVMQHAILAILENPANEDDIAYLKNKLMAVKSNISSIKTLNEEFPQQLNLGTSIQSFYNTFLNIYQKLILDSSIGEWSIIQMQLKDQLANQHESLRNKQEEILLAKHSLDLKEINFQRHEKLFLKGVISQLDMDKIEAEFLNEKRQFGFLEQQFNQLDLDRSTIEKNSQRINNSELSNSSIRQASLMMAKQELLNEISEWEESYLLKSPIQGKLSYNDVWGEFQSVRSGEVIFTVVPFERLNLIGKCYIPVKNSGKIREGQKVFLKLENFPYREWGTVKARVGYISQTPNMGKEPGYIVYLNIGNLKTSYGKELEFNQELMGSAEIILDEVTVIERLFYQFRHLWST